MVGRHGDGRDPCPDRITSDTGASFAMGALGGSVYHYILGARGAMKGRSVVSGIERVRMNAPRIGGSFAVWGGLFSMFDCSLVYIRQKEDPWDSIAAGAATSGLLCLRNGPRAVAVGGLAGGFLLAMIEGAMILSTRLQAQATQDLAGIAPQPMNVPNPFLPPTPQTPELNADNFAAESSSSSSWGLFSWGKKKNDASILESFDTPTPPVIYDYK